MAWPASYALLTLIVLAVLTPLSSYVVAVAKGHVNWMAPNIGETGSKPPESTIFTQFVVFTTVFVLLVIHIRYVFVASCCAINGVHPVYEKLNETSRYIGYCSCTGLLVLACFQESNAYYVHTISSKLLFTSGLLTYMTIQTYISHQLRQFSLIKRDVYARLVLNFFIIIFTFSYLVNFTICNWRCNHYECTSLELERDKPLLKFHLISAVSEWTLLILYIGYILTYMKEFKTIRLTATKIIVRADAEGT